MINDCEKNPDYMRLMKKFNFIKSTGNNNTNCSNTNLNSNNNNNNNNIYSIDNIHNIDPIKKKHKLQGKIQIIKNRPNKDNIYSNNNNHRYKENSNHLNINPNHNPNTYNKILISPVNITPINPNTPNSISNRITFNTNNNIPNHHLNSRSQNKNSLYNTNTLQKDNDQTEKNSNIQEMIDCNFGLVDAVNNLTNSLVSKNSTVNIKNDNINIKQYINTNSNIITPSSDEEDNIEYREEKVDYVINLKDNPISNYSNYYKDINSNPLSNKSTKTYKTNVTGKSNKSKFFYNNNTPYNSNPYSKSNMHIYKNTPEHDLSVRFINDEASFYAYNNANPNSNTNQNTNFHNKLISNTKEYGFLDEVRNRKSSTRINIDNFLSINDSSVLNILGFMLNESNSMFNIHSKIRKKIQMAFYSTYDNIIESFRMYEKDLEFVEYYIEHRRIKQPMIIKNGSKESSIIELVLKSRIKSKKVNKTMGFSMVYRNMMDKRIEGNEDINNDNNSNNNTEKYVNTWLLDLVKPSDNNIWIASEAEEVSYYTYT